ncbi:hypothetical protein N7457_005145 [Penicillium paradoxum]|uniref:uncharacterized protein n=1 Tax=Penicillium paradoxum TaxID=176176 RepID=UPI0025491299|nr:uncharacterized protein N7457_005145 [Penicillium paradoxum]KAJ5779985.1 hypothetical protein N7457_005145 [Penicillium paradoxum]
MTILCDKATGSNAAGGPDSLSWSEQNVTTLCTSECGKSLSSWNSAVETSCEGETIYSSGTFMLAQAIPALWYNRADEITPIRWSPDACYNQDESAIPAECSDPDWSITDISDSMKDVTRLYDRSLVKGKSPPTITRRMLTNHSYAVNVSSQYGDNV